MGPEPKAAQHGGFGTQAREEAGAVDLDWQSIAMWMGFAASVIKSGEPWTDQCQREFDEAKAAFARLSSTQPAPGAEKLRIDPVAVEKALGGSYDMPDGRGFWVDAPVAREMAKRVLAALQQEGAK